MVQPRLVAWCGDLPYRYSGETLPARAWPPSCARLRALVEEQVLRLSPPPHEAGVASPGDATRTFNHALGNLYRDGQDSMGYHADDEPELGVNPTVASVSLGAPRRFVLKARRPTDGSKLEFELQDGSLLLMGGSVQHHYVHGVPKQRAVGELRVNVTFRQLLRAPTNKAVK